MSTRDPDRDAEPSDEAYRLELRKFIADRPGLRFAEGMRVPRNADEESAIRAWLRVLYESGLPRSGLAGRVGRATRPPRRRET